MPADAGKAGNAPQLTPDMVAPALPAATDSIRNADRSVSRSASREEAGR
jgi:membrane protease subunit HflK